MSECSICQVAKPDVEERLGSTALCGYRDPVRWLCLHIHNSEDEAQACLAETVARGGGVFPIR